VIDAERQRYTDVSGHPPKFKNALDGPFSVAADLRAKFAYVAIKGGDKCLRDPRPLGWSLGSVKAPNSAIQAHELRGFQGMGAPRAAAKREYHSSRLRETESALAQARNRSGRVVPNTGLDLRRVFEKPRHQDGLGGGLVTVGTFLH
jgi:hypothetical protein